MPANTLYSAYLVACNLLLRLPGHRLRLAVLRRIVRAEVGPRCSIERGVQVTSRGGLQIGADCNVNARAVLDARGGLSIGQRVNVSPDVLIITADHDPQSADFAGRLRPVVIEDAVWLAERAIVLPGSRIGEGAVVAAGSVARGDVPARTIVAGNPALAVGTRSAGAQRTLEHYRRFLH